MINDLDIVQWAYLLDPAFQLVNSAGKPLTDGWIEVYIHGTRNKYYCASDFDGTLHPFKIPLDSLGSNIVLASPAYAYDIYVYNKFGSLVMSRYNVSPGNTGGNSGGGVQPTDEDAEHWLGQYGATQSLNGNSTGQTLYLPSRPDYQGDFVDRVEDNKYMYLKPGLYLVNCVIRFQQKAGTEVNRLDETLVYTGNGNANEDIAWQLDETGPLATGDRHCLKLTFIRKVLDTGETSTVDCSNILYFAPAPQVNWSDAYIQTLQIVKLGAGFGSSSASGGVEYKAGPGISIDIYNNISVTGMQPASSMGDYVTYEVYNEFVNNVTGDLNDLQSEIDAVSAAVSGGGGGGQSYTAGQYISIQGNEISVTGLQPEGDYASQSDLENLENAINNVTGDVEEITNIINNVTGDVTNLTEIVEGVTGDIEQLNNEVQTVSASIPESEEVEFEELDLSQFAQASAVTGLEAQIQEVSSAIPDVSEITNVINNVTGDVQNLTTIVENVTGDINNFETIVNNVTGDINVLETNISNVSGDVTNLTEIVNGVTGDISQIESDIQTVSSAVDSVSAQIPESEEVEFEELDISNFATNSQVTGLEAEIQEVSAAIPPYQVQSDWTQDDDTQVDYIKNKPEETDVVAGPGIYIVASGSTVTISTVGVATSGDISDLEAQIQTVSAAIPTDVVTHDELAGVTGDYATNEDLQYVSGAVDEVSGMIPESEEVEFKELDLSQFVTESAVTGLEAEIQAVSGAIPEAQVNSDWAATGGVAEILNKPEELPLIAGLHINITETANGIVISSSAGSVTGDYATHAELAQVAADVQTVSAAIPTDVVTHAELSAVTGDFATNEDLQTVSAAIPDISNLATESEVQFVSGAIEAVSAGIPAAQVQSDWTQTATGEPDYIKHKPTETPLIAGNNITLTQSASGLIISSEGGSVTGDYATHAELAQVAADVQTVSGAVDSVSASIPSQIEVEFKELDLSQFVTESAVTGLEAQIQTVSAAIPDVSNLATKSEVEAAVDTVTGMIPDVSNLATESDLQTVSGAVDSVSASIPASEEVEFEELDLSQYVTESAVTGLEAEIQTVSASIPAAQVNSDWNAVSGKAEILNKPSESNLLAGAGITIAASGDDFVISAQGGGGSSYTAGQYISIENNEIAVTGLQPEGDYATNTALQTVSAKVNEVSGSIPSQIEVEFKELDLSQFVTESAVTGLEADIQTVSAAIPDTSNFATEAELQTVSGAIPDVSSLATKTELQTVSGAVDSVSASIPSSEEVTFEEIDVSAFATEADLQTVSAAIPDVSNLATKTEVGNVEADVQTVSAAIPDVSNFATDADVSAAVSGLQNKLTGITDVVVTNSLPVSPVATVLYLIPEA